MPALSKHGVLAGLAGLLTAVLMTGCAHQKVFYSPSPPAPPPTEEASPPPPVPTISCSPDSAFIGPGQSVTIAAHGQSSSAIRSYSYSATAGSITAHGATAELNTAGVPPGTITITCNIVDGHGQTASATTTVTLQPPPPPPAPLSQALCSVSFAHDPRHPTRVDAEAHACLDDVALSLARSANARLAIVGNAANSEDALAAAQRAQSVATYLITEKGIDASRLSLNTGNSPRQTVSMYLVPPGANAPADGWKPVLLAPPVGESSPQRGPASVPSPMPTSEPPVSASGCYGFAVLAYPTPIHLDSSDLLANFSLFVGRYVAGKLPSSVLQAVCHSTTQNEACIDAIQWAKATDGCKAATLAIKPVEHLQTYGVIVQPTTAMPVSVKPSLQGLPANLAISPASQDPAPVKDGDGYAVFTWGASIAKPSITDHPNRYTGSLSLLDPSTNPPVGISLFNAPVSFDITTPPAGTLTLLDTFIKAVHDNPVLSSIAASLLTLLATFSKWLLAKLGWKNEPKEVEHPAPVAAALPAGQKEAEAKSSEPPVIIVVNHSPPAPPPARPAEQEHYPGRRPSHRQDR